MQKTRYLLFFLVIVVVPVALVCMDQQEQQICNYCRETSGQLKALQCHETHAFHQNCLTTALQIRPNACPTCNALIDPSLPRPTTIQSNGGLPPMQTEDFERQCWQNCLIGSTTMLCLFGAAAVKETYFKDE